MGDTGSMFFGGIVTALAFVMQRPELVLFFGIVYIWDAMTVVIQRTYFKATHGKRIFRMTRSTTPLRCAAGARSRSTASLR